MNQKNLFTIIGAVLILQGIAFYVMNEKVVTDSFPTLEPTGVYAAGILLTVMAMLSILVGLVAFAARETPSVLWGFTLGFTLLTINTLKHKFVDHINVPVFAMVIQVLITLACIYLWMQSRKTETTRSVKV